MNSPALDAAPYVTTVFQHRSDPLHLATSIAASGQLTDYLVYEKPGCWYVAGNPIGTVTVRADHVHSTLGGEYTQAWSDTPWSAIHTALNQTPLPKWRAYGWAGFELYQPHTADPNDILALFMVPGVELEITASTVRLHRHRDSTFQLDLTQVSTDAAPPTPVVISELDRDYLERVRQALRRIHAGEFQKVILSRRVDLPFSVNMPASYAAMRRHNTPARSFLLDLGGWQAAGVSPEIVLETDRTGLATTQPLAGTRARTGDPIRDAALAEELRTDPKEIFEHATSVRLAYTELDSVGDATRVREFLSVKERGSVQHLASRVQTQLTGHRTAWDALGAVFPAITASGIPKQPACTAISELEPGTRGLYSGAVIQADSTGTLDAALILRAVYQRNGQTWLRAGAGIVPGSTPEREHEETCEKLACVANHLVPATTPIATAPISPQATR